MTPFRLSAAPCHVPAAGAVRTAPCTMRPAALALVASAAFLLTGCASVGAGVGIGIPLVPGLSLSLGVGTGGPSIGLSTGWGPLGAGVGIDGGGRVVGSAGIGASAGPVGVGVGRAAVLYDPQLPPGAPSVMGTVQPGAVVPGPASAWRTAGDVEAP